MKTGLRNHGFVASGLWLVGMGCAAGQTPKATLPDSQPTVSRPAVDSPVQSGTKDVTAPQRLKVTWAGDVLTIAAENAGLNQILREVSKRTGMKVTGGVTDERVYGSYGPGPAEMVLAALLTGTRSNLLLKEGTADRPMELILSPRQGGASPPSPSSFGSAGDDAEAPVPVRPALMGPRRGPGGYGGVNAPAGGSGVNVAQDGDTGAPGAPDGSQDSSAGAPVGGDTSGASTSTAPGDAQSTSAPKSPQEIYDQLMKLQQQRSSQTATPNPPQPN